jgi:pyruvate formate lyase activating enzyme
VECLDIDRKAEFYKKNKDKSVKCLLCPKYCIIQDKQVGFCRARKNISGELYSMNYGKVSSLALDPVEKKPFLNFAKDKLILSAGSFGCNFKCDFCQNWVISQDEPMVMSMSPEELVEKAKNMVVGGNIGIAYTYNEPSIWYEFVYDSAVLAKSRGLKNVMVTNGYINTEPLELLIPYIDAMNIDIKFFRKENYENICNGELNVVKDTIEHVFDRCHLELTTMIIPGINDSVEEMKELCKWISQLSIEIPLHITRFFPNYMRLKDDITPIETLTNLKNLADSYLKNVYIGNVW